MNQRDTLGPCPECSSSVPRSRLLVEYEGGRRRCREGDHGMGRHLARSATFAECPNCREVVVPGAPGERSLDRPRLLRRLFGESDPREIGRKLAEVRDVLGEGAEIVTVGTTVLVDRQLTIDEKRVLDRWIAPQRMKNLVERDEARIEL